ncbi:MAG: carboxypeptidase regulatory-like domain-containing protein [Sciscionella sp.]|nr:carboxypeptidase regulatory-like domain-containing protein [Sciscionella sp.]
MFDGQQSTSGPYSAGCIYGARAGTSPWTLQTWSLSNDCTDPVGSAAEGHSGVLAAAFPGFWTDGHGVAYRVGVSPTIPATGSDQHISLTGGDTAYKTGIVSNIAGSGDFYVAWAQEFSNSHDGIYVKDVSAGTATRKAPQTGTDTINHLGVFANLAIANRNTNSGVYLAYCTNTSTCQLKLWHVGATSAITVPSSTNAGNVAISAGPSGRLWVAWYNASTNKVSVVRTNKAASKFGPVATFATPCFEHGLLGLSGGSYGRLDVAMQCVATSTLRPEEYVMQTRVSLHLSLNPSTVFNTTSHQVVATVTDAGDPVAGATVRFRTHHATTNSNGKATLTIPKGTPVGKHRVTASAPNYRSANATLTVKR